MLSRGRYRRLKITAVHSGNPVPQELSPESVYRLYSNTTHVHALPHGRPSLQETSAQVLYFRAVLGNGRLALPVVVRARGEPGPMSFTLMTITRRGTNHSPGKPGNGSASLPQARTG